MVRAVFRVPIVTTAIIVGSTLATHAAAQSNETTSPTDTPTPLSETQIDARAKFELGMRALADNRFADARELFQRSLAIVPKPETAFNLAVAFRGLGDYVAARDLCVALRTGKYGALRDEQRVQVEVVWSELGHELATLHIKVTGAPNANVSVDGAPVARAAGSSTVQLNPGARVVKAEAKGYHSDAQRVTVERGESVVLEFTMLRDLSLTPSSPNASEDDESGSIFEEPLFWVIAGGAVAAAAVTSVVLLTSGSGDSSGRDGTDELPEHFVGRAETLRLP